MPPRKCDLCGEREATKANIIFYVCDTCSPTDEPMLFGPLPSIVESHRRVKDRPERWSRHRAPSPAGKPAEGLGD